MREGVVFTVNFFSDWSIKTPSACKDAYEEITYLVSYDDE